MQLKLNKYQDIENELLTIKSTVQNFPTILDFSLPENYKNIVTRIKTTEISADCVVYNSFEAVNQTKEFVDKNFWCFGGDGQGNRWLLNDAGMVFYYDHDYDEGFEAMEINFEQWLQMAYLLSQMDEMLDADSFNKDAKAELIKALNLIHPNLSENFPYEF